MIVVDIMGGVAGALICATPDGLKCQLKSIHTHFLGLSCPLLLWRMLCHVCRFCWACVARSFKVKLLVLGAGNHVSSMNALILRFRVCRWLGELSGNASVLD